MNKVFRYELHRLLLNKFFLGLLAITMLYSYFVMDSEIVLGVANTAPFSCWSYGTFLTYVLPLLLITMLFFTTFLYSQKEKKVQTITDTTPADPAKYRLVRCASIIVGYLIISFATIAVSFFFYAMIFHFTGFGSFIAPILFVLMPAMFFVLGVGIVLGKMNPALVYALIPVVLLLTFLPLPDSINLLGKNFFSNYPATLGVVEPSFKVPFSVLTARALYTVIGIVLTLLSVTQFRKPFIDKKARI